MKTLFFADTPLQLYNSFLVASKPTQAYGKPSLVIYNQFSQARHLAKIYKELNVFDQILVIDSKKINSYKQALLWQISAIANHPMLDLSCLDGKKFDIFALACPTPVTMEIYLKLKKGNSAIRSVFYEDGTGTYNGNVFKQPFYFESPPEQSLKSANYINLIRKVASIRKNTSWRYDPLSIYVKRPSLLTFRPNIPCRKITPDSQAVKKLSLLLLGTKIPSFLNAKYLVFDVPRGKTEGFGAKTIDTILSKCSEKNTPESCFLRNHPRSLEKSQFANQCTDFSKGLWELMCQNADLDNCLLVGIGSTAQLAPYIESGATPPLLFLYKAAFSENDQHFKLGEQVLALAAKAYGSSAEKRIFVPATTEEALKIIAHFEQNSLS